MSAKPIVGREMQVISVLKMKDLRSLQITPPEDGETVYTVVINNIEFDYYKETGVLSRISKDEVMEDRQLESNVEQEKVLNVMEAGLHDMNKALEYLENNNKAQRKKKEIEQVKSEIADKKIEIACKKKEIGENIKELWKRNIYKVFILEPIEYEMTSKVKETIEQENL